MRQGAHNVLKLKRGEFVAFAERVNRHILIALRKTDPRMKGGRITEVLQCRPREVEEGKVYPGS